MEKINNILQALDKVLEDKELQIFMLKMDVDRLTEENAELKRKFYEAVTKGE